MYTYRVIQTVTFSMLDCPSFNNIKIFNLKINHYPVGTAGSSHTKIKQMRTLVRK